MEADKRNFPKRNRIVSALSDAVLVVEAEYRSGTSITVGYAKEQEKIVCCLPSNIDSRCGIGTNIMLQEGAKLIIKPNEIIELIQNKNLNQSEINIEKDINTASSYKSTNKKSKSPKVAKSKKNTRIEEKVEVVKKEVPKEYEEIYKIIGDKPIHINDICKISKRDIKEITPILTMLELEEYIQQLPNNQFKIKQN